MVIWIGEYVSVCLSVWFVHTSCRKCIHLSQKHSLGQQSFSRLHSIFRSCGKSSIQVVSTLLRRFSKYITIDVHIIDRSKLSILSAPVRGCFPSHNGFCPAYLWRSAWYKPACPMPTIMICSDFRHRPRSNRCRPAASPVREHRCFGARKVPSSILFYERSGNIGFPHALCFLFTIFMKLSAGDSRVGICFSIL